MDNVQFVESTMAVLNKYLKKLADQDKISHEEAQLVLAIREVELRYSEVTLSNS